MFKNKILAFVLISIFAISCAEEKSEIDIAESALDTAYVEYLFCDFGPDISQESFAELLIEWNDILDGLETAVPMSVGLVPRTETDLKYHSIQLITRRKTLVRCQARNRRINIQRMQYQVLIAQYQFLFFPLHMR